jgi:Protein of unknown function (DUF1440)
MSTVVRHWFRGAIAGVAGTLAMDLLWYRRARRAGSETGFLDWEFAAGLEGWDDAPAPAQVGRKLARVVLRRELPGERARLVTNVMHWSYGAAWGAGFGLLADRIPAVPWRGVAFGLTVWSSDYVTLPLAGVYQPIWKYDAKTLAKDASAHAVYGVVTDLALR